MRDDIIIGDLHIHKYVLGTVRTNCYILSNRKTKEAIVIDPADSADIIVEYIKKNDLTLTSILLTHGHFDHIMAATIIARDLHVDIYANKNEKDLLADGHMNYSINLGKDYGIEPDKLLEDGEILTLAGLSIKAIHTPGHTIGGNCYYLPNEKALFSGDTLFRETVGRTDLPTGNFSAIIASIKEKLLVLDNEILVLPGHGESTTIGYERENNEYLGEDRLWE